MVLRPQAAPPWRRPAPPTVTAVREQLRAQFPQLAALPIVRLGQGWDNTAWSVGPWVFRFPRREDTARLLARERIWLPQLAGVLPVAIPHPVFFGQPTEHCPWPFVGYRRLRGQTACSVSLTASQTRALAEAMGDALARLHARPVPDRLPRDEHGRTDPARVLAALQRRGVSGDIGALAASLQDTPRHRGAPVWTHGDLYARHLLLDERRRLCGVIDWGDLHAGDPATDLSLGFMLFGGVDRQTFLAAYGPVDAATAARARLRALYCSVVLAALGEGTGDAELLSVGRSGLERVRR